MTNEARLIITKFTHVDGRHYTARVSLDGTTINVEYRYGSWMMIDGEALREVKPFVAEALQAKMPARMRMRACERPKPKTINEALVEMAADIPPVITMDEHKPAAVLG